MTTMYSQLLFLLQFLRLTLGSDDYQCSSDFTLVTDLSQEDCDLEGKYYEEEHEGCFPGCYSALSNIAVPCDPQRCPPGYKCVGERCEIDEDSCFKYYANVSDNVYYTALWKPDCLASGKWAPKQCKGEATNGRCFCFDSVGNRIFGQEWVEDADDMTCACSRRKAELLDEGRWYVSFHCDTMGNYEELQCDSKLCWCVEPKTGALNSTVVPETMMEYLPCYNAAAVGSQYLRQCESQKYAQAYIENELKVHGNNYANFATLLCDDDGSYGVYKVQSSVAYCTWRDNTNLGSWQSQISATNSINCNCARDSRIFTNAGLTQNQGCSANGNYDPQQMANNLYYCVDNDGYLKSDYFEQSPDCSTYY